jgi:hypothetical protein
LSKSKVYEIEHWRSQRYMKSKTGEVKDIWSRRLKKSKIEEVKGWRSRRSKFWDSTRVCNSNWVSGATDEGMPFWYPQISIPGPAH